MVMYNFKKAFTLAEVLITLAIIGVVAILTVPNVISNYQEKVYDTQTKKVENELSNALAMLMADEEVSTLHDSSLFIDTFNGDTMENSVGMFFAKYLKTTKKCGYTTHTSICHEAGFIDSNQNDKYKDKIDYFPGIKSYCGKLKSGALVCIKPFSSGSFSYAYVDLNGEKAPNKTDKDVIFFSIAQDGSLNRTYYNGGEFVAYLEDNGGNEEGIAGALTTILGVTYEDALSMAGSSKIGTFGKGDCYVVKAAVEAQGGVVNCALPGPNIMPPPRN